MTDIFSKMDKAITQSSEILSKNQEQTGRKTIGVFHPVVPGELIYAAGLHPIRLFPRFDELITNGDAQLQTYLCSYVRAIWDQMIKGKYPYLNGVIIPRSCEAVTFLYQTWKRHAPQQYIDYINVPWKRTQNAIAFFVQELNRVKENLERFTGNEISEDSLRNAIGVYNRNRALLREISDLRKSESPPISGSEFFKVVMSSFVLDKQEHNELMERLLTQLTERPQTSKADVRLLISGGCVFDSHLWKMIESTGASIVADDVNNGSRSFFFSVEDTRNGALEDLATDYVMIPCAFNTSIADRFQYVSEMISTYKINGVIFAINKNCESEKFVFPELDKKIKREMSVSTLNIETDYLIDMAPLHNRVEAFIETLKNRG